jgi:hypothetical protein
MAVEVVDLGIATRRCTPAIVPVGQFSYSKIKMSVTYITTAIIFCGRQMRVPS